MKAIFRDKYKRLGILTVIIVVIALYCLIIRTNDATTITDTVQQKQFLVTNEPYLDKLKLDNYKLALQPIGDGSGEDEGPSVFPELQATESDTSTTSSYLKEGEKLNLNPRHICNCTNRVDPNIQRDKSENRITLVVESSCSDEATLLGKYQKVVSYSLYIDPKHKSEFDSKYFFGAAGNVEGVKKYYPGWVMRIYSNIDLDPNNEMCALVCSDTIIYYCDARRLPSIVHDSYICETSKDIIKRPFPTRRENISAFVGQRIMRNITNYPVVQKCPMSCRPPSHQDWEYC